MIADNTPTARSNIPEDWLIGMTCPVCGNTQLAIEREISQPDQMFCRSCMTLFEMSQDGGFIRLVRAPSNLPSDMASRWVKPASVGRMAYQYAQHTDALISLTDDNLSLEDRVKALIRLHNSPDKIREILYRLPGVSIEKIEEAIANANQQKSKNDPAWTIALGVGVLLLAVTLVVVLITLPGQQPGQQDLTSSPQPTAASNSFLNPSNLPAPIQTWIPPGVKILQPTPVVVRHLDPTTQPTVRCPRTPGEAALTFGGEMQEWSMSTQGGDGWYMISLSQKSIKVPKNMTAGYFEMAGSPSMESVIGPAMIDNVNFVSVSCD